MESTGERIKRVRKSAALTQVQFAKQLGVSRGAVANWERDEGVKLDNLKKIAERFECSVEWLSSGNSEAAPLSGDKTSSTSKQPFDRALFEAAHDMARSFEQTSVGGLVSISDFAYLVDKYYNELVTRKKSHGHDK